MHYTIFVGCMMNIYFYIILFLHIMFIYCGHVYDIKKCAVNNVYIHDSGLFIIELELHVLLKSFKMYTKTAGITSF